MRIKRLAFLAPLAVMVVGSCSTMQLTTDYDREVDFSQYATFDVLPGAEIKSYLLQERLEDAAVAALEARGLKRVRGDADLLIALHGRLSRQTEIIEGSFGYARGRWGYWGPYGYRGTTGVATIREVPVGTLVVDVVDARTKQLAWQAVASDTLDPQASPDEKVYRINKAMERIFAGFPPKAQ